VTVVLDYETGRIVWIGKGRGEETLQRRISMKNMVILIRISGYLRTMN